MRELNKDKAEPTRPKTVTGVYIFNEQNQLLLARAPKWNGKYSVIGGPIEYGESAKEAAIREAKEEVNLRLKNLKFAFFIDGLELAQHHAKGEKHLIIIDFIARAENPEDIKLSEELASYKWDSLDNWIRRDKKDFAPFIHEYLPKLKNCIAGHDFERLYLRTLADYQNLQKRIEQEKAELVKFGNERLILEILPAYGNLKIALRHARNAGIGEESIRRGIEYVIKQFTETLANYGVAEIVAEGRPFNHDEMDAVDKRQTNDKKLDGTVAEELKPGYKLNGKVIEHAKVAVWEYDNQVESRKSDSL